MDTQGSRNSIRKTVVQGERVLGNAIEYNAVHRVLYEVGPEARAITDHADSVMTGYKFTLDENTTVWTSTFNGTITNGTDTSDTGDVFLGAILVFVNFMVCSSCCMMSLVCFICRKRICSGNCCSENDLRRRRWRRRRRSSRQRTSLLIVLRTALRLIPPRSPMDAGQRNEEPPPPSLEPALTDRLPTYAEAMAHDFTGNGQDNVPDYTSWHLHVYHKGNPASYEMSVMVEQKGFYSRKSEDDVAGDGCSKPRLLIRRKPNIDTQGLSADH